MTRANPRRNRERAMIAGELKALFPELSSKQMKVLINYVYNHTKRAIYRKRLTTEPKP